jgi:membrane protease subunit (stomatin/prohibitin family)
MRQFTNQRWGTKNPVMVRDAEFGPVRLRAFGTYAFRVKDARLFLKEIAATNPEVTTEEINEQLRNIAVTRGMDAIAEAKIPVLDLASKFDEVSALITEKIQPEFSEIGLELTKFLLENVSLPAEVEAILDKRSGMGIVGDLGAFAQFQAANAMEKAAENPNGGGIMGAGLGAGIGAGMMGQMGNVFQSNTIANNQPQGAPPPLPGAVQYYFAVNGKQEGPFTTADIPALISKGSITKDTLAWTSGMAAWQAANSISELAGLMNTNTPPPLPGV